MKKTLFLAASLCWAVAAFAADANGPMKVWSYDNLKDVRISVDKGNKASLRLSPDVKTPDGKDTLEVSLEEFSPDAVSWSIQLRFVYDGGLKAGHGYEVSFLCKGSEPGTIQTVMALENSPWTGLPGSDSTIEVSRDWQMVKLSFTVKKDCDEPLAIPRFMPANYGNPATLHFGPATLRDLSQKQTVVESGNLIFNSSFEIGTRVTTS